MPSEFVSAIYQSCLAKYYQFFNQAPTTKKVFIWQRKGEL